MSSGVKKTNAMRMLDSAKIPYEVRTYEFEETDLAGVHAADAVGMPYETAPLPRMRQTSRMTRCSGSKTSSRSRTLALPRRKARITAL